MARIGVFVCHCGENISRTVDSAGVADAAKKMPGIVHAVDYKYMCSDPGQQMVKDAIAEHRLTGVVVAACSPRMHETTFRRASVEAGLNPYLCEMANIREQCSWVHEDKAAATDKAIDLVRIVVEKAKKNEELQSVPVPVTKRALVIGGGIAGMQAALDIANAGHEVVLVERTPSIGGHMAQLSETFPTLDCSQCILTPRMVEVGQHPNIKLYVYSEVESVDGFIGNFEVRIRQRAKSVDPKLCTGCGACEEACPQKKIPSEFDTGLGTRTAIYSPFPQAVPNKRVIDRENCLKFRTAREKGIPIEECTVCGKCYEACPIEPRKAVDFSQTDEVVTENVGAIVVATGFDLFPTDAYGEYGYGKHPDIISGLQFERLASASGPTLGEIRRPSDGQIPKSIVFIQCVGSRDNAKGIPYCSKICCMYTAKHTMLYKHKVHEGQAYVFYMDIRAGGKNYEEFVRRAIEEDGAIYLRGRVSRVYRKNGRLVVLGTDTLSAKKVEIEADMVVLATAIQAQLQTDKLAQTLGISYDQFEFLSEAHPKLRPVETNTAGLFLAGACQAPKDIPDTVAQAGCAAAKVLGLFSNEYLDSEPVVVSVDEEICTGCGLCVAACTYGARKMDEKKHVALVEEVLCQGCGACASACPSGATELKNFRSEQFVSMVDALT